MKNNLLIVAFSIALSAAAFSNTGNFSSSAIIDLESSLIQVDKEDEKKKKKEDKKENKDKKEKSSCNAQNTGSKPCCASVKK
jgi:hypothetical protein